MLWMMDACNFVFSYVQYRNVDEDDIQMNMQQLKKTDWFQQYLQTQPYRDLIIFDEHVRMAIGKLNKKRVAKNPYKETYQRIITKALHRKLIVS